MVDDRPRPHVDNASVSGSRRVLARSRVSMSPATAKRVASNEMAKGDVLGTARFAGIQAAKEADSYLPLCDPVAQVHVLVDFTVGDGFIDVLVSGGHGGDPAPRLQSLTAATAAALTIYDMCKSVDRTMVIGPVELAIESESPES